MSKRIKLEDNYRVKHKYQDEEFDIKHEVKSEYDDYYEVKIKDEDDQYNTGRNVTFNETDDVILGILKRIDINAFVTTLMRCCTSKFTQSLFHLRYFPCLADSVPLASTRGPADSSSNYLSLKSIATPGDRGDRRYGLDLKWNPQLISGKRRGRKGKPNFEPSGLLAAATNQKNGIALKYTKPPESRMPTQCWKLFVFKPKDDNTEEVMIIKTIPIDKQDHYLIGKDQRVADIDLYHPTISKQHAVIQHKINNQTKDISPYLIDLESTNGTFLNDERIEPCRYYELREKDVLKFGRSSREYILLHDKSVEHGYNLDE